MFPIRLIAIASAVLLLLVPATVQAEDEPSPAQRFADATKQPHTDAGLGFRFEAEVRLQGVPFGTCTFSAVIETAEDGTVRWRCRDDAMLGAPDAMAQLDEAILDPHFVLLEGTVVRGRGDEEHVWRWKRDSAGFEITPPSGEVETVAHEGPALNTFASLVLFTRSVLSQGGTFEAPAWSPRYNLAAGEKPIEATRITLTGTGPWQETEALLVEVTRNQREVTLAFHPDTKEVLGIEMRNPARGQTVLLLPLGEGPPDDLGLDRPAETPEAAALRAQLAIATADLDLLTEVIHWPSLHADAISTVPGMDMPLEDYKKQVLDQLASRLQPASRDAVEITLRAAAPNLLVARSGEDRAVVTFPEAQGGQVLEVGRVDGVWYLVKLPGSP